MQKNFCPPNVVLSDTSSLINLIAIGKLNIFKELYENIVITPEIFKEYKDGSKEELPKWIIIKEVKNKGKIAELNKKYGLGESSAIAFALENPNTLIVIDDQKAKDYASSIGLFVIGTIGIIKQAVDNNIIKSKIEANSLFDDLKNKSGRISKKLLNDIKYPIPKIDEMKCYKHEIKKDKIIDFRGNEINIKTIEIVSENDNLYKLECVDRKGNNIYILQRIKNGITDNWYFDKNFNKDSAFYFVYSFDKKNNKILNKNINDANGGNSSSSRK